MLMTQIQPRPEAINYIIDLAQHRQQNKAPRIFTDEISARCINGVAYAASLFYAEYLGFTIVGQYEPWVRKVRKYPTSTHPNLLSGIRKILAAENVTLTDDARLISTLPKNRPPALR